MQQFVRSLDASARWSIAMRRTGGAGSLIGLGVLYGLRLYIGADAHYLPAVDGLIFGSFMIGSIAAGLLLYRYYPKQFEAALDSTRQEVRANLIDRGLLQLVLEDQARDRLPSLFRPVPMTGQLHVPQLTSRRADENSLQERLRALVWRYPACCREAGLDPRPSRRIPWFLGGWNNALLLRCAVAMEISAALTE